MGMAFSAVSAFEGAAAGSDALSLPVGTVDLDGGWQLTVYDDLQAVENIWRDFQKGADCTAFQTFEWLSAWHRNIGSKNGVTPAIILARGADGGILFILPLARQSAYFVREITWLGSNLCDYNAPLLASDFSQRVDERGIRSLWDATLRLLRNIPALQFDVIRLEKMPESVRAQRNPMLALPTTLNPSGSYATPLADNWETFYAAKRSGSTRGRDRSKRKRLAEHGQLEFVTAKTAAQARATIEVLAAQKSAHFARLGISNLFARPGYLNFLKDVASCPDAAGLTHVSELHVGSQVAAASFALTFGGRYYYVLSSYTDGELSRLGPGSVHLQELLRYAIENHFTIFDFTIGDERYKLDWCDGTSPLYDHISTASLRGFVWVVLARLLKTVKRTIKQTPILWACFTKLRSLLAGIRLA